MNNRPQAFKKGVSGNPAGKPKGASLLKLNFNVRQLLEEMNFNPFRQLAELAQNSKNEKIKCDASKELCKYTSPQLKAIEHNVGSIGNPLAVVLIPDNGKRPIEEIKKIGS